MQMACIEGARNTAGIEGASTTEFGDTSEPVVGLITEWMSPEGLQKRSADTDMGGTMRLGAYPARLLPGSKAAQAYGAGEISERHRHRFEFTNRYREPLASAGMLFSGLSPDERLVEISELRDHPFMVGSQFHPEFKTRLDEPHPLFRDFIGAAIRTLHEGDPLPLPLPEREEVPA